MKTSKITALVIAGLTATTIAGVALAEGPGGMGMMRGGPMAGLDFAAVDADKDGKITVAEMTAHRAARFAAADTDKDGKLSRAEMDASRSQRMQDHGMEHRGMRMPAPTEKEKPAN